MVRSTNKLGPSRPLKLTVATPIWDEVKHELWFRGKLVKRLSRRATAQAPICRAFEIHRWIFRILNPLLSKYDIDPVQRLHDAIKLLNRGQGIIHFGGDGTGLGVIWQAA
jgi:hypothetical protein